MLFDSYRRFVKSSLTVFVLTAIFTGLTWIFSRSTNVTGQTQIRESIEVHVEQPLQWANSCDNDLGYRLNARPDVASYSAVLKVSLDLSNRSVETVYLPDKDVDIELSVVQVPNLSGEKGDENWLPLYPISDMVPGWEARPLLPDKSTRLDVCFYNTTPVVNFKETEGRRIPLRGKFRIRAWYFPTRDDWQNNKEDHAKRRSSTDNPDKTLGPHVMTLEVDIPCLGAGCRPGCNNPPWILPGEGVSTIDISAKSDRGAEINRELARKFPACAENNPAH